MEDQSQQKWRNFKEVKNETFLNLSAIPTHKTLRFSVNITLEVWCFNTIEDLPDPLSLGSDQLHSVYLVLFSERHTVCVCVCAGRRNKGKESVRSMYKGWESLHGQGGCEFVVRKKGGGVSNSMISPLQIPPFKITGYKHAHILLPSLFSLFWSCQSCYIGTSIDIVSVAVVVDIGLFFLSSQKYRQASSLLSPLFFFFQKTWQDFWQRKMTYRLILHDKGFSVSLVQKNSLFFCYMWV